MTTARRVGHLRNSALLAVRPGVPDWVYRKALSGYLPVEPVKMRHGSTGANVSPHSLPI
jgi:hypothetical protein